MEELSPGSMRSHAVKKSSWNSARKGCGRNDSSDYFRNRLLPGRQHFNPIGRSGRNSFGAIFTGFIFTPPAGTVPQDYKPSWNGKYKKYVPNAQRRTNIQHFHSFVQGENTPGTQFRRRSLFHRHVRQQGLFLWICMGQSPVGTLRRRLC